MNRPRSKPPPAAALGPLETELAALFNAALNALVVVDAQHRVVRFNPAAESMFQCSAAEAIGEPIARFLPEAAPLVDKIRSAAAPGHGLPTHCRTRSGAEFPATVSLAILASPERPLVFIIRDTTQDHAHTAELERVNRMYAALSQINQAIVRTKTRDALFDSVCQALVDHGGFRMAWIGWHDRESQRLIPVSQAGKEEKYIRNVKIYGDARLEGTGPTGKAFRENRPAVCNDALTDPVMRPWLQNLQQTEIRALTALPIRQRGTPCGALTVYADQRDFFQDKEVALLVEVSNDLSFALDNLADAGQRREADDAVKRLAAIVETTHDAVIGLAVDGTITTWNAAATELFDYGAAEVIGQSINMLIPADRMEERPRILRSIVSGEHVRHYETVRLRKDGTRVPVSMTYSQIWSPDETAPQSRRILGASAIVRDLTVRKQMEALAEREKRIADGTIEAMPGILYLYTEAGQFLRWNDNFLKVSGYSAEEIRQKHPLDFFSGAARERVQWRIAEVFEKGEASIEAPFVSRDGTETPYYFTGKRIVLDGMACLVGVGVDISERKEAEAALVKSEERYRTTLDTMLEGCQILDRHWRYVYLNEAAALQNRRPNRELLGKTMPEMWPGIEDTPVFALFRRCMEERVPTHGEIDFAFPDGATGWFDVRVQPTPEGIFVVSMDISERKRAERALRDLNESLELKVTQRTHELSVALERAEAADRTKSAFLATMSHELRTPLNSIIGFTGIILRGLAGPLNPEQSKQLGMVQGSARHLLALINDVLDISKIEAGQLEIRTAPFDLKALAEQAAGLVTPLAEKKQLALQLAIAPGLEPLESDRRRVEQILINLLNNAIKFTERGTVWLTVERLDAAAASGSGVKAPAIRMRIADTGIGIKEADLPKLFQPFRQLDTGLQRQHEGTGLGLAICRRLTDFLGGTIAVESTFGKGSVFSVVLPVKRT